MINLIFFFANHQLGEMVEVYCLSSGDDTQVTEFLTEFSTIPEPQNTL